MRGGLYHDRGKRLASKKKLRAVWFVALGTAGLFLAVSVLSWVSTRESLLVRDVRVVGSSLSDKETLAEIAVRDLSGNFLGLFAKANRIIFPKHSVLSDIEKIPAVSSAAAVLSDGGLVLNIVERTPEGLWCTGGLGAAKGLSGAGEKCFYVDGKGFVFSAAPYFSGDAYMRYFGGIASSSPIGENFMTTEKFAQSEFLLRSINTLGMNPEALAVDDNGDIHVILDTKGEILFSPSESYEDALNNLASFLSDKVSVADSKAFIENVKYIDLRFGQKIYYREK